MQGQGPVYMSDSLKIALGTHVSNHMCAHAAGLLQLAWLWRSNGVQRDVPIAQRAQQEAYDQEGVTKMHKWSECVCILYGQWCWTEVYASLDRA